MSAKARKVAAVVLWFGHVEDARVAPLILMARGKPHDTKAEAVKSLARYFFEKWLEDEGLDGGGSPAKPRKCCEETRKGDAEALYCKKCGGELAGSEFDSEEYEDYLADHVGHTANSWGSDEGVWHPWTSVSEVAALSRGAECLEIREDAQEVLTYALDPEAEWMPERCRREIREYRARKLVNHASNRLGKKGLDIDGLIDADARTFSEARARDD